MDTTKFAGVLRYIDDIIAINFPNFKKLVRLQDKNGEQIDHGNVDGSFIYPSYLPLNQSNSHDKNCDFLDLNIRIGPSGAKFSVYDKRRSFGFDIVKFPHSLSCVHEKTLRGVIVGQLKRYSDVCLLYSKFKLEIRNLFKDFVLRGWGIHPFLL